MFDKIKIFIVRFTEYLSNIILESIRVILFMCNKSYLEKKNINIAIYRIGNIGDIICSLPSINIIKKKFPDANITLITSKGKSINSGAIDFLKKHNSITNILDYDPTKLKSFSELKKFIKLLRSKNFDLWIDLPVQYENLLKIIFRILFAKICRAKSGFGWNIGNKPYFPLVQIKKTKFQNEIHRLLKIIKNNLNLQNIKEKISFDLPIDKEIENKITALSTNYNKDNLPIVIIAPGSKRTPNIWKLENFIDLSTYIVKRGYFVFIIGGNLEKVYTKKIEERVKKNIKNLSGQLSILESAYLIKISSICICVDSGAQHIAAAVGTKVISLFSGRDFPGMWYPEGLKNIVLREVDICDCFLKDSCVDNKCINKITVNHVSNTFDKINV